MGRVGGLGVKSRDLGPSKTAQWVRILAAKPHSLNLNLGTHVMDVRTDSDLHTHIVSLEYSKRRMNLGNI